MYASQTKRLCVRGAPSDETTRVQQQHSSATTASTTSEAIINNQQQTITSTSTTTKQPTNKSPQPTSSNSTNMTATAISSNDPKTTPDLSAKTTPSSSTPTNHSNDNNQINATTKNSTFAAAIAAANISRDINEHELIERLASETLEETILEYILSLRNLITACNKKKDSIVKDPHFRKLLRLLDEEKNSCHVLTQMALLLCSVAKSGEYSVRILHDMLVEEKILHLILISRDLQLIEACLRCMRALMSYPKISKSRIIYDNNYNNNIPREKQIVTATTVTYGTKLHKIIACAKDSTSFIIQECVADIFALTCDRKNQSLLYNADALPCITKLLESPSYKVTMATINWLTQICMQNQLISLEILKTKCPSGLYVIDRLICLMSKDKSNEMQFLSARSFSHIYRSVGDSVVKDIEHKVTNHVLPCLVRMVHKDKSPQLRIKSAECIAYLIESDTSLQTTASYCDHLIDSLANMLQYQHNSILMDIKNYPKTQYKCSRVQDRGVSWLSVTSSAQDPPALDLRPACQIEHLTKTTISDVRPTKSKFDIDFDDVDDNVQIGLEMKRAAFLALASLASNLESIRTKIFNTCSIMQNLVKSLTESDTKTLKSVLTCLLSLSRSVQQLRTSFAENSVYSALKGLLTVTPNDVLILVLAILCNVSLDFSPGKQHFLDSKTIETLCDLTRRSDPILKLHGIWILMNMVYQMKDYNLKLDIIKTLDMGHILNVLVTEKDEEIILKTLGFLRNLLSQKNHIDNIMSKYGTQIMQSLTHMLQKSYNHKIKEHTLCVLTNIADGPESKSLIMENETILNYLSRIISDEQGDLRLAGICCITNLAHKDCEGSNQRRLEMKKFGIEEKLKSMLDTNDPALSDRVRTAYSYFYS